MRPSGSGPNSIRLWEALGYGAIPVILADHLWLPGDAELPLRLRRSLQTAKPSRAVLIRIDDNAPAERLQIRWQAALRICEPLLRDRPWRVVSLAPGLEQGVPWNRGCGPAGTGVP